MSVLKQLTSGLQQFLQAPDHQKVLNYRRAQKCAELSALTHPPHPPVYNLFQSYISAKNKDNDMKLSGCDPWGSGLDWTYSKLDLTCSQLDSTCSQLDLTVKHLLKIALRWGTVLKPGDYFTTLHYITLHYTTLHLTTVHYTTL